MLFFGRSQVLRQVSLCPYRRTASSAPTKTRFYSFVLSFNIQTDSHRLPCLQSHLHSLASRVAIGRHLEAFSQRVSYQLNFLLRLKWIRTIQALPNYARVICVYYSPYNCCCIHSSGNYALRDRHPERSGHWTGIYSQPLRPRKNSAVLTTIDSRCRRSLWRRPVVLNIHQSLCLLLFSAWSFGDQSDNRFEEF